jgi:hypothetical protein
MRELLRLNKMRPRHKLPKLKKVNVVQVERWDDIKPEWMTESIWKTKTCQTRRTGGEIKRKKKLTTIYIIRVYFIPLAHRIFHHTFFIKKKLKNLYLQHENSCHEWNGNHHKKWKSTRQMLYEANLQLICQPTREFSNN